MTAAEKLPELEDEDVPPVVAKTLVDTTWLLFLVDLDLTRRHRRAAIARMGEVMSWPRSTQPHIELIDDRGVVFTWNDGERYADLAVAPNGRVTWFSDDMTTKKSGACKAAEALPEEFRQFIEAMHP